MQQPPNGPDRNGTNGQYHPEDDPDDIGAFEPVEDIPPVPPGQVISTDSNGVELIIPAHLQRLPPDQRYHTKRTPENRKRIITALRLGVTFKLAAAYAGMSYDAFHAWRNDDIEFAEEVERAIGVAATQWMNIIEEAAKVDWRAAAWKLQRRFPTEYGRSVNEVTGPNGGPIQVREITVKVPDALGIDDDGLIDEGPPELLLPSGDE